MKYFFLLLILSITNVAFAGQISDVTSARCTSASGSYFRMDVQRANLAIKFAQLGEMNNISSDGYHDQIQVIEDWPKNGLSTVGSIVANSKTGYWGSAGLVAESSRGLKNKELLSALFTDAAGNTQEETLICDLTFAAGEKDQANAHTDETGCIVQFLIDEVAPVAGAQVGTRFSSSYFR